MNELLKAKYYKLINIKDFEHYEEVGNVLANIENELIKSNYHISKAELITLAESIKIFEERVYSELIQDINSGLIGGCNDGR